MNLTFVRATYNNDDFVFVNLYEIPHNTVENTEASIRHTL